MSCREGAARWTGVPSGTFREVRELIEENVVSGFCAQLHLRENFPLEYLQPSGFRPIPPGTNATSCGLRRSKRAQVCRFPSPFERPTSTHFKNGIKFGGKYLRKYVP